MALCLLQADRDLSVKGEDGRLYHWILPSFFQLLRDLSQEGREFAILFRTFGTDLPRVLKAVSRALDGAHPLFPDLPQLKVTNTGIHSAVILDETALYNDNVCDKLEMAWMEEQGWNRF